MPPKKYSNIAAPPRRFTRTTARKSTIRPDLSAAGTAVAVQNSPEIRTATKRKATPKDKPLPVSSQTTSASSVPTKTNPSPKSDAVNVDRRSEPTPTPTPSDMDSEVTAQIGVHKTVIENLSPAPEKAEKNGDEMPVNTNEISEVEPLSVDVSAEAAARGMDCESTPPIRAEQNVVEKPSRPLDNDAVLEKRTGPKKKLVKKIKTKSNSTSSNMNSEINTQIGPQKTLVENLSPPPEKVVIEAADKTNVEAPVDYSVEGVSEGNPQLVAVPAEVTPDHMDSEISPQIGSEKTPAEKADQPPENAEITVGKKKIVKKMVRIVKKVVKKKVPKKKDQLNEMPVTGEPSANDVEKLSGDVVGEIQAKNANSLDHCNIEFEIPNPVEPVNAANENCKPVESNPMEVDNNTHNDDTFIMETENLKSSVVLDSADVCESIPTFVIAPQTEKPSLDIETQMESELFKIEKPTEFLEVQKPSHDAVMQKESEVTFDEKDDGSLIENISKVPDLDSVRPMFTSSKTKSQVEDQNVDPLIDQSNDSKIEKNMDFEIAEGKHEEGVKEKEETCDSGGMKAETLLDDGVLSGEMEALERRRRRKTEIFVGGLDKDTKEDDIRNIFEEIGEVVEVRLMTSSKSKKNKGFAFVRYSLAADAKKALAKFHTVEICGRQCGTSLAEGNDTLFLRNIDKKWKSDDVVKLLREIGIEKIDHVTVIVDPNKTNFNRGFGFVEFETIKDAQYAYNKLQKKGVFGKHLHIKVAWAEPLIEPDENEVLKVKSVYAEYLPSTWDEEKVKDCFRKFGEIENVLLAKDMPSSRRKDFAFVNYSTREAALACIYACNREPIINGDSKIKVKVSLANPNTKSQHMKHLRNHASKELSKENNMGNKPYLKPHQSRNKAKATSSNFEDTRVDQRSSMTSELVQLLREQASARQTRPGIGIGSINLESSYPPPGRKRPFDVLGDDSYYSDPRGNPRARVEGFYPTTYPSVPIHSVGMTSLPHQYRQGAGAVSERSYGVEDYTHYVQTRERAPYHGSGVIYRRY